LNDNVNGRKWESAFADTLAEKPSSGMLKSSNDVRRLLLVTLCRCTTDQQEKISLSVARYITSAYPGNWLNGDVDCTVFLNASEDPSKLRNFLNMQATDGPSCMSTYLVGARLLKAIEDEAPEVATWKQASDRNYELLQEESGEEKFPEDGYQEGPDAGMLMRHQIPPNFETGEKDRVRGVLSSVTDFDQRTAVMDAALQTGRPNIWGSSGTTSFLLHFLADASRNPATKDAVNRLDINHMILGISTMVMHDGGHSLREVLRVVEQTSDKLPDPVRQTLTPSHEPASNYGAFFERFKYDRQTYSLLKRANDEAWRATLEYRRDLRRG
jgi:hypothetical protein